MNSEGAARRTGRCPSRASAATMKGVREEDCPLVSICPQTAHRMSATEHAGRFVLKFGIASQKRIEPYRVYYLSSPDTHSAEGDCAALRHCNYPCQRGIAVGEARTTQAHTTPSIRICDLREPRCRRQRRRCRWSAPIAPETTCRSVDNTLAQPRQPAGLM